MAAAAAAKCSSKWRKEIGSGKRLIRQIMPNLLRRLSRSLSTERKAKAAPADNPPPPTAAGPAADNPRKSKSRDSSRHRLLFRKKPKESPLVKAKGDEKVLKAIQPVISDGHLLALEESTIPAAAAAEVSDSESGSSVSCDENVAAAAAAASICDQSQKHIETCFACHAAILGYDAITVTLSSTNHTTAHPTTSFHPSCFRCSTCNRVLTSDNHYVYEERLLCWNDYKLALQASTPAADLCHVCGLELQRSGGIADGGGPHEVVSVKGRQFHPACFLCSNCGFRPESGREVTIVQDKVFCCDNEPISSPPACHTCNRPIRKAEPSISIDDHIWHRTCFRCSRCNIVIGSRSPGSLSSCDADHPLCSRCFNKVFMTTCNTCNGVIETSAIEAGSKRYHPQCAFCSVCGGPFSQGKEIMVEGDEVWHPKCSELRNSIRQMEGYLSHVASPLEPTPGRRRRRSQPGADEEESRGAELVRPSALYMPPAATVHRRFNAAVSPEQKSLLGQFGVPPRGTGAAVRGRSRERPRGRITDRAGKQPTIQESELEEQDPPPSTPSPDIVQAYLLGSQRFHERSLNNTR